MGILPATSKKAQKPNQPAPKGASQRNNMTPSEAAKSAGLDSLAELIRLSGVSKSTLIDQHRDNPDKFKLAIDAALYRREKR